MPRKAALRLLCALALCSVAKLGAAAEEAFTLPLLMQQLAGKRSGQARFTETKYLALLEQPLRASGVLAFSAPDRLEKRTLEPRAETLLLEGEQLTLQAGARKRTLALRQYPQIAAFVEGIRATLVGDRATLERVYHAELSGSAARWQLVLRPREVALQAMVSRIVIGGREASVSEVQIEQADGDRSVMQVEAP